MKVASSAIILKDKRILLIKRSNYTTVYPGFWSCPGGRAEKNETPEQNVIREVKEEVNLEFEPTKLIKKGFYENNNLYLFYGHWTGKVRIQEEEVDAWNWFTFREALNLKLAFDYRNTLEMLYDLNYI